MRGRLPLAFHLNSLAMLLFFAAVFVHSPRWKPVLQWLAGAAVVCGIVFLVMRK